jgi:hypothetical protein
MAALFGLSIAAGAFCRSIEKRSLARSPGRPLPKRAICAHVVGGAGGADHHDRRHRHLPRALVEIVRPAADAWVADLR